MSAELHRRLLVATITLLSLPLLAQSAEIEVDFVNGTYTDLDHAIQPVERGGMTIHVSSPEHRLSVYSNRLRLTDNGDGTVDATFEATFEGEGHIVAKFETGGGVGNAFEDQVAAPRQTVSVSGTARLEHIEAGYLMTVVEAPPSVELEIQSGMASRLVSFCKAFESFLPIDCASMGTALSVITAPLPQAGEQFVIQDSRLTADERAYFDRFAR